MQGTLLAGRYLLAEPIGRGGMGTVYRATDQRTGGTVAVKLLHDEALEDPANAESLRREARLAAAIASPRVVRVIDVDEQDGLPFLVLEYVAGETLQDLLRREGRLPPHEALALCLEVSRALEAAHAAGVVHRDLKPQNIKLVEGQLKVLDFGIARPAAPVDASRTLGFSGTPQYSAPERAWSRGDIRSDIYSLGVILYRLLEGRLPFSAPTAQALLFQHASVPVPPLSPGTPAAVQEIITRCLAKAPEDRYQTPTELSAALTAAIREVQPPPVHGPVVISRPASAAQQPGVAAAGDSAAHPARTGKAMKPSSSVPWARIAVPTAAVAVAIVALAAFLALRGTLASGRHAARATGTLTGARAGGAPGGAGPLLALNGPATRVNVSDPSRPLLLGFDGTAGRSLTLALTDVSGCSADYCIDMAVADSSGKELGTASAGSAGAPLHLDPLPASGHYTVALNLENARSAQATLHLFENQAGTLTAGGQPLQVRLQQPWQEARVTFDGTSGQRLDLVVGDVINTTADCCIAVVVQRPDGAPLASTTSVGTQGATLPLPPLPTTGPYTIVVTPDAAVSSSLTLTLRGGGT
jgi:hypothetical protein